MKIAVFAWLKSQGENAKTALEKGVVPVDEKQCKLRFPICHPDHHNQAAFNQLVTLHSSLATLFTLGCRSTNSLCPTNAQHHPELANRQLPG